MIPLQDERTSNRFPLWVIIIILVNVYVFFLEITAGNSDDFFARYALVPSLVTLAHPASLLPFITSQFLHAGFLHIIANMWFLWIFGDNVEGRVDFAFFPLFYLSSGLVGNILQYIFIPASNIPILGASGAIAGILGAYFALFGNNKVKTLVFIFLFITIIDIPASFVLFFWFIIQLFSSAVSISTTTADIGGVAYFAHIGGFATGWLMGKILVLRFTQTKG